MVSTWQSMQRGSASKRKTPTSFISHLKSSCSLLVPKTRMRKRLVTPTWKLRRRRMKGSTSQSQMTQKQQQPSKRRQFPIQTRGSPPLLQKPRRKVRSRRQNPTPSPLHLPKILKSRCKSLHLKNCKALYLQQRSP